MKKVLYAIIGLLVIYLILCLVGKSEAKVERSITINGSVDAIKAAIADHKVFQEKWSPWREKDTAAKVTFEGEEGKPGSKMSWVSEKKEVGKGSMTLNSFNGDSVVQTLHFDDFGDSKIYHIVTAQGTGANVTWGMQSKPPFLFRGMAMFMNMEAMIAPDFEKGLMKLKSYVESMPSVPTAANYEVKEIDWTDKTFVGTKATMSFDKLAGFFGDNFHKIFEELEKSKVKIMMAPSAIFFKYDEQKGETECAAVACVPAGTKVKGWETFNIPAAKALQIAYYGGYGNMTAPHAAMDEYMKAHNMTQSVVVEEYVSDPGTEPDSTKWLTNIYYILMPSGK
jgi:effector-binding domain-containing protein